MEIFNNNKQLLPSPMLFSIYTRIFGLWEKWTFHQITEETFWILYYIIKITKYYENDNIIYFLPCISIYSIAIL